MTEDLRRGDVVWVDFGKPRGSEPEGRRPALVVQNDVGNKVSPNTIVASITTTIKSYPVSVVLNPHEGGLPEKSMVDCASITAISQERILRKIGKLNADKMAAVDQALKNSLGLS